MKMKLQAFDNNQSDRNDFCHEFTRAICVFFAGGVVLLAGCKKEQISVYKVAKESDSAQPVTATAAHGGAPVMARLKYTVPAGWHEEAPVGMSQAQFTIGDKKAEVSAMSFPGEAASQLSLINIARENAGLPDLTDDQMAKLTEPVTIANEKGSLIDFSGATKSGTNASNLGVSLAVVAHGGATWFFKLSGDPDVVVAQKPTLLEFLKSISFEVPAPGAVMAQDAQLPAGHPSVGGGLPPMGGTAPAMDSGAANDNNKPAWEVPAGWKEVPPTQMLLAKFTVGGETAAANVTISVFPGEVGGLLANVNRWRGMAGQPPIESSELAKTTQSIDVGAGKATLVDVAGRNPQSGKDVRLLGVIFPRNGQTWFYKLMGDAPAVTKENEAFIKFVQSAKYPND